MIRFGAWRPDMPDLQTGAAKALNVIPVPGGYGPIKDLAASSDALTAKAQGAVAMRDDSDNVVNFSGDATKLYKLATGSWGDVSRLAGGAYATPTDGFWQFAQFGTLGIAVNGVDDTQSFSLPAGSNFAALSGSPPVAKYCGVVKDFLVLAWLGSSDRTVQWSGQGDATQWTAGVNLSDSQVLQSGGEIKQFVGGEFGTIFQAGQITRMDFVGAPVIFSFSTVEVGRGLFAPRSAVKVGPLIYYLAADGFFVFNGAESIPIGLGKVDKTFFEQYDTSPDKITGALDFINGLIKWSYVSTDSQDGEPDKLIIYSLKTGEWGEANIPVQLLYSGASEGFTLEGLDNISASIDALPASLDSSIWKGGQEALYSFDTANKQSTFTGDVLAATIETNEFEPSPNRRVFLSEVWPAWDASVSVRIGHRNRQQDAVSFTSASTVNSAGFAPFRVDAKYLRGEFSSSASASWNFAQGFDQTLAESGVV